MRFHKLKSLLFSSLLKGVTFKMIGITAFFLVWFIFVLENWIELFILYIAMPSFQLRQWKLPSAIQIQGHDSSLSLKFSSILGLCDPILPRLCRSRTLYFEISNELSEHIWNHKGKFLCDESFQLNAFHVFATAVKLIHIASRHLSTVMDG